MKLSEVLLKIDKKVKDNVNIDPFCLATGVPEYGWKKEFDERVVAYPVEKWVCTDTTVGVFLVFLDDVFCAVTAQFARRSETEIHFLGEVNFDRMRNFLVSLADEQVYRDCTIIEDEDWEVPQTRSDYSKYPGYYKIG